MYNLARVHRSPKANNLVVWCAILPMCRETTRRTTWQNGGTWPGEYWQDSSTGRRHVSNQVRKKETKSYLV